MADRFEARMDDLVEILALENGKVVDEARFEVAMAAPKLRFYAALALTEFGRAIQTEPGHYSTVYREPMGVAGIIAPWNSPIVLFIRSLEPALASRCTVVGKVAVREAYVAGSKVFALHVKFNIAEVVQMAPDWAFVRTNSAGTMKINATGATSDEANQELFILRKEAGGEWKIARYSFSSTNPPPKQ